MTQSQRVGGWSIAEVLRSSAYQRTASILAYLTAFGNLLDALTTAIGLSLGAHEAVGVTIAIMNRFGVGGWILLKVGMACIYLGAGVLFQRRWTRFRPLGCMFLLIIIGVSFIEFGLLPAVNNLYELGRYWGLVFVPQTG